MNSVLPKTSPKAFAWLSAVPNNFMKVFEVIAIDVHVLAVACSEGAI